MLERLECEVKLACYPDVVTVKDLMHILDITEKTAYSLLKRGKIKHFITGNHYGIPKVCIIDFMTNSEYEVFERRIQNTSFRKINEKKDEVERTKQKILFLCEKPQTRKDLMYLLDEKSKKTFFRLYLRPLLESGKLQMTHPEQPSISTQRYIRALISEK